MVSTGNARFDAYYSAFDSLTIGGVIAAAWSPDGRSLAYVDGPDDERRGWVVDTASGQRTELVDIDRVRDGIRAATGQTPPGRGLPFAEVRYVAPGVIGAPVGSHVITVDLAGGEVTAEPVVDANDELIRAVFGYASRSPRTYWQTRALIAAAELAEVPSPDGRHLASTRDGDIVLRSTYDGRERALTTDGTRAYEWRFDADFPALTKYGWVDQVTNWSPDGTRLAAYRVDNRGLSRVPVVHYLNRNLELEYHDRTQAGGRLERSTLHLLDVFGGPAIDVDLGDTTDTYPVFAGWLPDGSQVLVVRVSRDCRRADVLAVDAATGAVRELFSEVGETFVRIQHDVIHGRKLSLWLTPGGERILWLSERDGWKHLYLYDLCGRLVRRLTGGEWPVDRVLRVAGGHVYFTAHHDQARPYDTHVCRVGLDGGEVERLTDGEGVHRAVFSPDAGVFVDTFSTPSRPPVSVLRRDDGTQLAELSRADVSRLEGVGWTSPEQFTVTAADGKTRLWGVMYFPADFDPALSYPLVEYVYGGPQCATDTHDWPGSFFTRPARALAQMGYVTVLLDARGTPERSKAFHDSVYKNWMQTRIADHSGAIRQLTDRHVPRRRAGRHSWGGYTAFRLVVDRPDVYRAAVAHAPGFDPYRSVLYEPYLGLPHDDPDAYEAADPLRVAARLAHPFLLACGTADHATWADAITMTEALIRAGKAHEFVVLPEQPHWYDTTHESYFWRKFATFFTTHIGTPRTPAPSRDADPAS